MGSDLALDRAAASAPVAGRAGWQARRRWRRERSGRQRWRLGLGGEANTRGRGRGTEATAARAAAPRCYGSAPGFFPFRAFSEPTGTVRLVVS